MTAEEINAPAGPGCKCWRCLDERGSAVWWMVVCVKCGCKRCPHANDHRNDCTDSNKSGQPGSAYTDGSDEWMDRCRQRDVFRRE